MKRRLFTVVAVFFIALHLQASIDSGFGLDAFNRAVSATARANAVFSPFSFEVDSVIFSEAVDALTRSKLAETMGVLNGLELAYKPMHEALTSACNTNHIFRDARGFCVPNERKILPSYRQWLQTSFSAEAFSHKVREGAQCWFHARLDGDMEDFVIPENASGGDGYSYFDLVSAQFFWADPFPTNNQTDIRFHVDSSTDITCAAICDVRDADICQRRNYSSLKLQISADSYFFAVMPNPNMTIRDIRGELNSNTIHDFVNSFKSVTDPDVSHGRVSVTIPKMDILYESDLKLPFNYFNFLSNGLDCMEKDIQPRYLRQRVRFRLDGRGLDGNLASESPSERLLKSARAKKPFTLNRPFLFFVYHEPTTTIPIVGQFMGR